MEITDEDEGPVGDYGVDRMVSGINLDLMKESGNDPCSDASLLSIGFVMYSIHS